MAASLFVYGTLMFQPIAKLVTGHTFPSRPAMASGFERRVVIDKPYPAMIATPNLGPPIRGRLWFEVDDASLARLDYYEDDFYVRREISVRCHRGQEHRAWCYLVSEEQAHLLGGPWDDEAFRQHQLRDFLRELAAEGDTSASPRRACQAAQLAGKSEVP